MAPGAACALHSGIAVLAVADDMSSVLVDEEHVYFTRNGIWRVPRCGGPEQRVSTLAPGRLFGAGRYVYAPTGKNEFSRVDKATLATVRLGRAGDCIGLAARRDDLYAFVACDMDALTLPLSRTWTLFRARSDGTGWLTLGTGPLEKAVGGILSDFQLGLAVDADHAYLVRGQEVKRAPLDTPSWDLLATTDGSSGPDVVLAGEDLFIGSPSSEPTVRRIPRSGGSPVDVVKGVPIGVEGGRLYVSATTGVSVTDRDGASPEVRLARPHPDVRVRDGRFYWAERGLVLTAEREEADVVSPPDTTAAVWMDPLTSPAVQGITHLAPRRHGGVVGAGYTCKDPAADAGFVPPTQTADLIAYDAGGKIAWSRSFDGAPPPGPASAPMYSFPPTLRWPTCNTSGSLVPPIDLDVDGGGRIFFLAYDGSGDGGLTPRTLLRRLSDQGQDDLQVEVRAKRMAVAPDGTVYLVRDSVTTGLEIEALDAQFISRWTTQAGITVPGATLTIVGAAPRAPGVTVAVLRGASPVGPSTLTSTLFTIDLAGKVSSALVLAGAQVRALAGTADGGMLVAGTAGGFVDLGRGREVVAFPGSENLFVARYGASGAVAWLRFARREGVCQTPSFALTDDGAGGAALALGSVCGATVYFGPTSAPGNLLTDSFIARLNGSGALAWGRSARAGSAIALETSGTIAFTEWPRGRRFVGTMPP